MAQPYKICPICNTPNHRHAALCSTCGTTLSEVPAITRSDQKRPQVVQYDHEFGETDLSEGNLRWNGGTYVLGGIAAVILIACISFALLFGIQFVNGLRQSAPNALITVTPVATAGRGQFSPGIITNTPRPTVFLTTVTPAPPTASPSPLPTETSLPGPCVQQVQPNDDLISILFRCGHRTYDDALLQEIVEMNNLTDPSQIVVGEEIQVPWPEPTADPNAISSPATEAAVREGDVIAMETSPQVENVGGFNVRQRPTETLQPGVIWHRVQKDENIIIIAYNYGANLKILSELNPEITFSQCDFGLDAGGENCNVQIFENQLVRVPAPTPTATVPATASGSETPTPSASPTFNTPGLLSPSDRAFFGRDDIITLRWIPTGTLGAGQSYLVRVEEMESGIIYSATTTQLSYIVPQEWQAEGSGRRDYTWMVSVIAKDRPENPLYTTEARTFTWQGRGSN